MIIGATRLSQLEDNLGALDFRLSPGQLARLDAAGAPEQQYPYYFFGAELQGMVHGGATVGDKPDGYYRSVRVSGAGAGVQ